MWLFLRHDITEIVEKHPKSCSEQVLVLDEEPLTWGRPLWLLYTPGAEDHPAVSYSILAKPSVCWENFEGENTKISQISWGPASLKLHLAITGWRRKATGVWWSSLSISSRINVSMFDLHGPLTTPALSRVALQRIGLNFAIDPIDVAGDAGIDPGLVLLSAPIAPADHAHQGHPVIVSTDERTPRISLWLKRSQKEKKK